MSGFVSRSLLAGCTLLFSGSLLLAESTAGSPPDSAATGATALSYDKNIAPIVKAACLPCHAADNDNDSELSLDTYDLLMKGGKHGPAIVPGKPDESSFAFKLDPKPQYGRQMPRKRGPLTDAEVEMIRRWIAEGAKR